MKFIPSLAVLFLSTVAALPSPHKPAPQFPISDSVTVKEGSEKCGDQAQLSCCNKAVYGGDITLVTTGSQLSHLLGAGSASEGAGIFDECSKLDLAIILGVDNILNQHCKQNIACCEKSEGTMLPCVALGSIL